MWVKFMPAHVPFIVKSNRENYSKIRWFLTKLQRKISRLLFLWSTIKRRDTYRETVNHKSQCCQSFVRRWPCKQWTDHTRSTYEHRRHALLGQVYTGTSTYTVTDTRHRHVNTRVHSACGIVANTSTATSSSLTASLETLVLIKSQIPLR